MYPTALEGILVPGTQNDNGLEGKEPALVPVPFSSIFVLKFKLIGVGVVLPPITALNKFIIAPGKFPAAWPCR